MLTYLCHLTGGIEMKFTKALFAGLMAVSLAACSKPVESASSVQEEASAESASSAEEEIATSGSYDVKNVCGETVNELYFYKTGDSEKGKNYAEGGLADGSNVKVEIEVSEEEAADYHMTVEFVTEGGEDIVAFDNLSLEEANMYLKSSADVESGATPFTEPEA